MTARALAIIVPLVVSGMVSPVVAEAQNSAAPTCMSLPTADEVAKAVAPGFKDMGGRIRGEGETECPWMLSTGGFRVWARRGRPASHSGGCVNLASGR